MRRPAGPELLGDAAALCFGAGLFAGQLFASGGQLGGLVFQTLAQGGYVLDFSLMFLPGDVELRRSSSSRRRASSSC